MSVPASVKYVRLAGSMVPKPVNVRVSGAWQSVQTVTGQIYLTPSTGSYANGATVTVTIRENSFSTAVNSVQANLTYDPAVLTYVSADTSASAFTSTLQKTGGSGSVQIGVGILGSDLSGDQLIATVTFTAIATASDTTVAVDSSSAIYRSSDSADVLNILTGSNYQIT